jgi:hypothetical protein
VKTAVMILELSISTLWFAEVLLNDTADFGNIKEDLGKETRF